MDRAEWIALLAAVGTLLGLIPTYGQYFKSRKTKKSPKKNSSNHSTQPTGSDLVADRPKEMGAWGKALVCTSIGVLIFVVELIVFSWVAHLFSVKMNFIAMPLNWKVAFIILFVVPVFFIHLASLHIISTMTD